MENQENKFVSFTQKYGHYIVGALAFIALGLMFAPLLGVGLVGNDGRLAYVTLANAFTKDGPQYSWFMIVAASLTLIGGVLVLFKNKNKTFSALGILTLIIALVFFALIKKVFKLDERYQSVDIAAGFIASIAFLSLATLLSLTLFYSVEKMTVRDIAEEGMLIALAFVLNLITFFKAPTGGSVNLQMLPLFILALRHGPTHGLISAGIVYGLISMATDGYTFACYPFDYLIGFGSVAIIGAFKPQILNKYLDESKPLTKGYVIGESFLFLAGVLATFVRFVGSTLSSIIVWEYSFKAAALYNSIYIPVSGALALLSTMLLLPAIVQLNKRFPVVHSYLL